MAIPNPKKFAVLQLVERSGTPLGAPAEEQIAKRTNEGSPPSGGGHGAGVNLNGWMGVGKSGPCFILLGRTV